jgi:ABC-type branched-subunit amino acid transport system ATPase component
MTSSPTGAELDPSTLEVTDADRARARELLGLGTATVDEAGEPLRDVLRRHHLGWYVVAVLGLLGLADTLQGYAFGVLAPEIGRTLGISRSQIATVNALKTLASAAMTVPLVMLVQRRPRRALVSIVGAFVWAVFAISTGFVTGIVGLGVVLAIDGATSGTRATMHMPLLADSYPPTARVRVLSVYTGFSAAGNIVAPLTVAVLATAAGLTWRGVFVVTGVVALVAAVLALRLRDPGFGHFDTDRVRELGAAGAIVEAPTLGFAEVTRRLLLIPTIRRMMAAWVVLGVMAIPTGTFVTFLLDERWGLGPGGRGAIAALQAITALVSLSLFGRRGEALLRRSPPGVVRLASVFVLASTLSTAAGALSPNLAGVVILLVAGSAGMAMLAPAVGALQMALVPAEMRPHAVALGGLATGVGGLTGSLYLAGIDRRFGVVGAIVALAIPGVIAALVVRSTGRLVERDLDRMVTEVIETSRVAAAASSGGRLPLLAARGIDAGYGDLQVLFGTELVVHEGEIVALLGTNGSGKSTLLKVVSGLLLPQQGSVRLDGRDITYVAPERRVRMGIQQIPGGKAVFAPLTVLENLQVDAESLDVSPADRARRVDRCFEVFPQLEPRRHQRAGTLSGGEQQMLALAKAVITRPRLLLVDELSLGLAPTIVAQLLERVRTLRDEGTSIVLVEQSVNVALSIADRAYFLEKGTVRFEGGAELLDRHDLLRSVFLGGHADGTGAHS